MNASFILCELKVGAIYTKQHKEVFNPLTTKVFNWNLHSLEVVSRWRDPQLQVGENYSYLPK